MLKVLPTLHHPCPLHKLFITISLMGQKTRKKNKLWGLYMQSLRTGESGEKCVE